jgi:hypothetical protein
MSGCASGECGGAFRSGGAPDGEVAESEGGDASWEEELRDCCCCHRRWGF